MKDKAIPVESVRAALAAAKIKRYADRAGGVAQAREMHFGVMDRGDMGAVIDKVRLHGGIAEVRKTWGAGMRQLQAECASGVMP